MVTSQQATTHVGRRQFLLTMGLFAAGALAGPAGRIARAAAVPAPSLETFTQHGQALGTQISMTVLHRDRHVAEMAAKEAIHELEQIDALMSIYRPDSQVSRLNRTGRLAEADPRLLEVLHEAQAMAGRSGGAFDITVQPLWQVFSAARAEGKLPEESVIQGARSKVDWRKVQISGAQVSIDAGMAITLNGIAQGYAADRCMAALRRRGIEHALVNTGELAALGHNPQGQPWTVGIQHPREEEAYAALARLDGRCLATSGDYATTFSADRLNHHIFDPATGHSPQSLSSASVACNSACLADALSTAIFVLGPERGMELAQSMPGVDVLLITRDGRQMATNSFPKAS